MDELYIKLRRHVYERLDIGRDVADSELYEVIDTAQIIQQKEEVMSEVDTIISGKKMEQRVMSLIPAVIVIYLKVTAKEFIQPLYGNIAGIIIMTVCLGVYVISDMWAKRIVNIEV